VYYATYTALDGAAISQQFLGTKDLVQVEAATGSAMPSGAVPGDFAPEDATARAKVRK